MRHPVSLELFAGAGGMALGVHRAGFRCVYAAEMDKWAQATFRAAFPQVRCDRVELKTGSEPGIVHGGDLVDLLAGGPPCVGFSHAGKGLGALDPRDGFPVTIAMVRRYRPRAVLLENVAALASRKHRDYLDLVVTELRGAGYAVGWRILDAADFGVPQRRKRIFIVAFRREVLQRAVDRGGRGVWSWPAKTHSQEALVRAKWITGEYWAEWGLGGPESWPLVGSSDESRVESGERRVGSGDEPSPVVRGSDGGAHHAHRISTSRSGHSRIEYPLVAPSHDRGPSDAFRRHPVQVADLTATTQAKASPAYMLCEKHPPSTPDTPGGAVRSGGDGHTAPPAYLARGAAPTPSHDELRILRRLQGEGKPSEIEEALARVQLQRWRTVRDAIGAQVGRVGPGPTLHSPPVELPEPRAATLLDVGHEGEHKGGSRAKSVLYKPTLPDLPVQTISAVAEMRGSEHAMRGAVAESALSPLVQARIESGEVDHILQKHPPRKLDEASPTVESNIAKGAYYGLVDVGSLRLTPAQEAQLRKKKAGAFTRSDNGHVMGSMPFPDVVDAPSRVVSGENAHGTNRDTLVIDAADLRALPQSSRPMVPDAPGDAVQGGSASSYHGQKIVVRNLGAGDGDGARLDDPSPVVPANMGGTQGLAYMDASTRHEYADGNGRIHNRPTVTLRRLTTAECAALQAFPPDWPWQGPKTAIYKQVGNACPPPLAEVVARRIRAVLEVADVEPASDSGEAA